MIGGKPKVSDLVIGARNMIEAADIRPGDSVLLLADRSSDGDSIDALASALRLHGATPMEMIVEPILRYGDVPEAALRAMEAVDVAVWVWPVFLNGSTNYRERLRTPMRYRAAARPRRSESVRPSHGIAAIKTTVSSTMPRRFPSASRGAISGSKLKSPRPAANSIPARTTWMPISTTSTVPMSTPFALASHARSAME